MVRAGSRTRLVVAAVVAVLSACTADGSAGPSTSQASETSTSEPPLVSTVDAPASTSTIDTSPSSKAPTKIAAVTSTLPPTTAVADPSAIGVELAQQLATAFAQDDWDTARRISPEPAWDDATYEEGFAGLEAATLVETSFYDEPGRLVMYLMQVAHETRDSGPQTSIYCVRWDLLLESLTIERVAGELLTRDSGFTPPADAAGGAWACDRFDIGGISTERSTPPPEHDEAPIDQLPSGWTIVNYQAVDYVCEPSVFAGYGNFDCVRLTDPLPSSITFPELRCSERLGSYQCTADGYYPAELDRYETVTYGGQEYICEPAWFGSSDYDCATWFGGALPIITTPTLWCTARGASSFECTTEGYYPSEIDGFEISEIGSDRVLCRWDQCWIWDSWETPTQTTLGLPDYICSLGRCERY